MKFSEKIKNIPLWVRKIILWTVVVVLGIVLVYFWAKINIPKLSQAWNPEELSRELKIPSLKERISGGIPEFEKLKSLLNTLSGPQLQNKTDFSTSSFPNIDQ